MSFNPLMSLLVRGLVDLLDRAPTVIELGNQTFNSNEAALDQVIKRSTGVDGIDVEGLRQLKERLGRREKESAAAYYAALGFSAYDAIDINDTYGSLVMDLNQDIQASYGFNKTYDLVTNNGTGEHIFDQASVLRNMHNLTKSQGIMLHVMPMLNYINHGFYCFQPCLYYALARANGYELLGLGMADRRGMGLVAKPEAGARHLSGCLLEETVISLPMMLGKARFSNKGRFPLFKSFRRRLLGRKSGGNELGTVIQALDTRFRNVLVFAALRKVNSEAFQLPIQTLYADDFSDHEMRSGYSADAVPMPGAR